MRIPRREQAPLVHEDEAEGALERREHLERGGLEAVPGLTRQERRDQVRVRRGCAAAAGPFGQLERVHQVAVVPERERAMSVRLERGLRVLPCGRAGGRVAVVADPQVALQRGERGLVEDLRDEPELPVDEEVLAIGDRHPGGFLSPMLLREEPEVDEPGDLLARGPHPEQAAFLFRTLCPHAPRCYQRPPTRLGERVSLDGLSGQRTRVGTRWIALFV